MTLGNVELVAAPCHVELVAAPCRRSLRLLADWGQCRWGKCKRLLRFERCCDRCRLVRERALFMTSCRMRKVFLCRSSTGCWALDAGRYGRWCQVSVWLGCSSELLA